MLPNSRVIFSDNGTLLDYSRELSDLNEAGASLVIVAAEDALFVGSDLPFNHRHFQIDEDQDPNSVAGSVSVSIWDGGAWRAAVNVLDMTKLSGVPFARSGQILWTPDRDYDWAPEQTTEDMGAPLSGVKIYDKYWAKFTFSAAFTTKLKYVGHKFSKDSDLNIYYPDINRAEVREAYFGDDTAAYDLLHIAAAEEIIRDLRSRGIIWSENQILEPDQFRDASAHKVAEMLYSPGGLNQPDKMERAVEKYKEAMSRLNFKVDKAGTGKITPAIGFSSSIVRRR